MSSERPLILLRYTLVVATAALLLAEHQLALPSAVAFLVALALASNLGLALLSGERSGSPLYRASLVAGDVAWVTAALLLSGHFDATFFYAYFFVLLVAAIADTLVLAVAASACACGAYLYVLAISGVPLLDVAVLLRLPFLLAVAATHGHLLERARHAQRDAALEPFTQHAAACTAALNRAREALACESAARGYAEAKQAEEAQASTALTQARQELIAALAAPSFLDRAREITTACLGAESSQILLWSAKKRAFVEADDSLLPAARSTKRTAGIPREQLAPVLAKLEEENDVAVTTPRLTSAGGEPSAPTQLYLALRRGDALRGLQVVNFAGCPPSLAATTISNAHALAADMSLALEVAQLAANLERANRLKSEFVSTMSHELRTPLNVLMGYHSLLLEGTLGELTPEQADPLRRAARSARQLQDLITETLDFRLLETGRMATPVQEVGLTELLVEIAAETRCLFDDKPAVRFSWDLSPPGLHLQTNRAHLKTILKNLIGNAIKFTEEGSVTVSGGQREDGVELSVSDTGPGIPAEVLPVIFEPFRQGDGSATRRYSGVGLGLHVVRRLVDLLDGAVVVESEVGRGATFRFWIPDANPDNETGAGAARVGLGGGCVNSQ